MFGVGFAAVTFRFDGLVTRSGATALIGLVGTVARLRLLRGMCVINTGLGLPISPSLGNGMSRPCSKIFTRCLRMH